MLPEEVYKACGKALEGGIPFACCRRPGEESVIFFADMDGIPSENSISFEIGKWLKPYAERIVIHRQLDAGALLSLPSDFRSPLKASPIPFCPEETITRQAYLDVVGSIIGNCREREGKTVYSRVIAGSNPGLDIPDAAGRLFDTFPDAFGFLFCHPLTGCWLGATPETLLSADFTSNRFHTMALAGTRPAVGPAVPWDEKNFCENRFVVDFFSERLTQLSLDFEISAPETIGYGPIEHLRRDITGTLPYASTDIALESIIDSINPTPALCGTPAENALRDLAEYEPHDRQCYGGFVALRTASRFDAFVNLRSARISTNPDRQFNLYVGGGITAASDPASEYAETTAKASTLLSILSHPAHHSHNSPQNPLQSLRINNI